MIRHLYSVLSAAHRPGCGAPDAMRLLSCGVVLLCLVGCQGSWSSRRPASPPLLSTTETIWQHLQGRRRSYTNLKGLAHLQLRLPNGGGTLDNTVVALERFEHIRLEGIGPFGQPLFLLIAAEQRFGLYLPQERRVLEGPATPEPFVRLFGFAVEPRVLPHILVGDLPFQSWPTPEPVTYLADDRLYFWEGQALPHLQRYRVWIDPYRLLPVRFEMVEATGRVVLEVRYEDFRQFDGLTLPYHITMIQPHTERRAVWDYREVQLNEGVSPALFQLRVPPGTERVELN
ncbi:MAG: outer membrane lipoprotein-sorting protein [Candidatus Tectomicrobia bacterium]|nr:outer membrane lipoprotein-sorting protein [Candidatus Tectomicrobia bacterium]